MNKGIGISVFLFFLSVYVFTSNAHIGNFESKMLYSLTQNMVEKREISMSEDFEATGLWKGKNPKCEPGQAFLAIPFYLMGKFISYVLPEKFNERLVTEYSVSLFSQVVSALIPVVMFLFCRMLGYSLKVCIIVTLIYGLGTMGWIYSKDFFREPVLTLFILLSVFFLYWFKMARERYLAFLAGVCLGMSIFVKIAMVSYIIPLIYYFVTIEKTRLDDRQGKECKGKWKDFIVLILPVLFFIGVMLLYNYKRFGNMFLGGYQGEEFSTPTIVGVYGLLFSFGKGLFEYNPILFLFFPAIVWFYKEKREEAKAIMFIIILNTLLISGWHAWSGEWCWGPRYLVPLLPYYVLPIGMLLERSRFFKRKNGKVLFMLIFGISFLIQGLSVSVNPSRYLAKIASKEGGGIERSYFSMKYSPIWNQFISLREVIKIMKDKKIDRNILHSESERLIREPSKFEFSWSMIDIFPVWLFYFGISKIIFCSYLILNVGLILISGFSIYSVLSGVTSRQK